MAVTGSRVLAAAGSETGRRYPAKVLMTSAGPEDAVRSLLADADEAGGADNATAVVVAVPPA